MLVGVRPSLRDAFGGPGPSFVCVGGRTEDPTERERERDPKPYTLNPKPYTLNPKRQVPKEGDKQRRAQHLRTFWARSIFPSFRVSTQQRVLDCGCRRATQNKGFLILGNK